MFCCESELYIVGGAATDPIKLMLPPTMVSASGGEPTTSWSQGNYYKTLTYLKEKKSLFLLHQIPQVL